MSSGSEPPWLAVAAYAVHTRSCTYVLDRAGVCHWVLGPNGGPASTMERCIGAQFVACIDAREPGQLIGEIRLGASALFACHDGQRFVLLRSPPIEWVEQRPPPGEPPLPQFGETTERLTGMGEVPPRAPLPPPRRPAPPLAPAPRLPKPPPVQAPPLAVAPPLAPPPRSVPPTPGPLPPVTPPPQRRSEPRASVPPPLEPYRDPSASVEEIVSYSEVTLTMPLYQRDDDVEPPPPYRHRETLSRGQRLR